MLPPTTPFRAQTPGHCPAGAPSVSPAAVLFRRPPAAGRPSFSAPRPGRGRRPVWLGLGVLGLVGALACNDLSKLAGTQALPAGVSDPSVYHTAPGAMALYQADLAAFDSSLVITMMRVTGVMTDELQAEDLGSTSLTGTPSAQDLEDARQFGASDNTDAGTVYDGAQAVRGGGRDRDRRSHRV